jgi:phospholipid transport system transporter-binding protein
MPHFANIEVRGHTLYVKGVMDLRTVPCLQHQGKALILANEARRLVFDLSGISACDSAGVALLLAWFRFCRKQQKEFILCGVTDRMRAIMEVSRLASFLPIM